jgi:hypothetical protein
MRNSITILIAISVVISSCNTRSEGVHDANQSKAITSSKLVSPKDLINEAQEYYGNNNFYKCLASLSELEEKYPNSEECKKGFFLKEKAINETINKIETNDFKEKKTYNNIKVANFYNYVKSVEISSNNVDKKITEEILCKTLIELEDGYVIVSGYTPKKTYFEILSTGNLMGANYYDVKTNQKESTFLFDTENNTVVWQLIKHDNSGLQVYFTNK